ncbi:MAG: hypothetical protein ACRDO2_01380 [Nocardioidaceae bacterium]
MSESLRDLLRQGADTVEGPRLNVDYLVAQAKRRLVRRRLAAVAASVVAVVMISAGGFALQPDDQTPAPAPPSPDKTDRRLGTPRALTYAEGATIHYGDQIIEAGGVVDFVEATDDGVVYVLQDDDRVWFSDGSVTDQIGEAERIHFTVQIVTANPGSLVAWDERTESDPDSDELVVYDSQLRQIVARIQQPEGSHSLVVNRDRIYWEVTRRGGAPAVRRFDVSSAISASISFDTYHSELASNPRMLRIGRPTYWDAGIPDRVAQRQAYFKQVGRRLVASDSVSRGSLANSTAPTRLLDGRALRLRVPHGYGAGFDESLVAVQWLDDGHLVLFSHHEHNEFPAHVADLLVCPVPTGTCRVVVAASDTPYVAPGDIP